jgi:hypothetical protein
LGERLVRNEEVSGSIPLGSTKFTKALAVCSAKAFSFGVTHGVTRGSR